ncbi:obscurin isoform X6 [Rhipicephalus microplus]|uniref:obscurin isoform X6 n=1 Tax=Rhipicephalus microplus TaxID=6941 RepID=UPI003F6A9DFC
MSYSRSSYSRTSKYSEGLSDERSSRTSARSSSLMDSDISSSMSSTRRMVRTTSYGDDGGGSYSSTAVRRSSRLSALDDDDIGSSTRMQSSSVRTSRLSSRNDDDFGSSAITRRALAISSGDSFESSRKSSLTSSILGESMDSAASRALRRLSKDDDKESFSSKRSKLTSKSSFDVDESSASVRYSSTKISSTIESSDLGGASYVASKSSYSYRDSAGSVTEPEAGVIGGIYEAILDYKPLSSDDEGLPLKEGQEVEVIDTSKPRKWRVRTRSSRTGISQEGWVPCCYLEKKEGAVVEEHVAPKDRESYAKREAVVKELVETEEDFSRDMQRVVNNYLKEMENPVMPKELRDQKDVLFSNFKDICDFHNTELIKGVQFNASEPAKLGVTFLRLERDFDKHVKYCEDFPRAQELLASGPLKEYFDDFSARINDDKTLSDHLKLPIQRINDYQLLLKELIKYTARLHEDYSDLQRALDFMQAIPQRASDLQYINAIEGYHGNIHNWGRVIKHGSFDVIDAKNCEQLRYLFLFKGRLCVTEVKKIRANRNIYLLKNVIKTTESEIVDDGEDEATLKVIQKDSSGQDVPITLRAKDIEQKKEWARELQASKVSSEVIEEMQVDDASEHQQEKSSYSRTTSLSESTAVPVSPEPASSSMPRVELFEASKEATSAATQSIRSGSVTSIDEIQSLNSFAEDESVYLTASKKDATGKPQFRKALRGLTCSLNDNTFLECEVSSPEKPTIHWLKDNIPLKRSARVQTTEEEGKYKLHINDASTEDSGMYTVIASNSEGTTSCSAPLYVKPALSVSKPDSRPTSPGGTILPHAPVFKVRMKDTELLEGTSVRFQLVVRGCPEPEVTVYKDGKKLKEDDRVRVIFESKEVFELVIDHICFDDMGKYTCVAVNSEGKDESSGRITVTTTPTFKKELKDVSVMTDDVLKLDVQVQGTPAPDVKWYKDGQAVVEDDRVKITQPAEDKHALIIEHAKVEDSGNYSCVISNTMGTQTGFSAVSVNAPPKFLQKLKDYEASETENVTFRVKVSGNPKPNVCWKKDGKPMKLDGHRYQAIEETENVHCLIIDDVHKEDAAQYTVEIANEYGVETDSAALTITCKPKFKKPLSDVECCERDTNIKITVEVEGAPTPKVKWSLNDSLIVEDKSFKFESVEESGKYTLVIKEAKADMTGEMACEAENVKGKDKCSGNFTVKSKPKIVKGLDDIDVEVGQSATFSAKVANAKDAKVKWLKDDFEVTIDNKNVYAKEEADATFTLVINSVKPEDAGKYTFKIKNELGEDSSTGRLGTQKKPEFKKRLQDQEISEEDVAEFTVEVVGEPKPNVKWLHGKREIKENDVYQMTSDGDTYTLKVRKPNKELAGEYTCEAQNPYGKESCAASLTIHSKPEILEGLKDIEGEVGDAAFFTVKIAGSPTPTVVWKKDDEEITVEATIKEIAQGKSYKVEFDELTLQLAGNYECVATNKYGSASSRGKLSVQSKPKFEKKPEDQCVYSGEECVFEAKVSGYPTPTVTWSRDGETIEESEKFTITSHDGTHRLIVKDTKKDDECFYTCTAKNNLGRVSQQAELTIKLPDDAEAPTFIRRMADTVAVIGDKVRFEVRVAGKPTPKVTWYKDGEELLESRRVEIKEDGDTHTITLKDLTMRDEAKYSCKAVNQKGEASDKAQLTVKEPVAPAIKGLKDQEASTGSTVKFQATITGIPAPDVVWKKDGKELSASHRITISSDVESESYSLIIQDVDDDFGQYTCKASNSAGETEANAMLTLKGEPPVFIKELEDVRININEEAVFHARIKGNPTPSVTWLLNGTILNDSEETILTQQGDSYTLKIKCVTSHEIGEVVCKAKNTSGQASSKASLTLTESAPTIAQSLPSKVRVEDGEPLKLEAKVPGHPEPEVQWLKDGEPVVPSDHIKLTQEPDGTVALEVDEISPADAGHYAVVANNDKGKAATESDVETKPKGDDSVKSPAFSEGLKDATLTEGAPGHLEAKLAKGSAPSDVQWLKDGEPVKPSDHIKMVEKPDGTIALDIDKVTPSDAGHYSVLAENDEGKAASDADVKTKPSDLEGKPVFDEGLKPTTLTEGEPGRLEAKMPAAAATPVEWTKDGEPVKPTDHVKLVEEPDGTVALELDEVIPDDAGHYAVKATNDKGSTSSEADVKTEPKSAEPKKPRFEKELKPATLPEGKPAHLEAKVAPDALPLKVEWLKDGKPVKLDDHVRAEQKPDGTLALSIDNVKPQDAGHYAVVASNDAGKTPSEADVDTVPAKAAKDQKPVFEKGLEPTELIEGKPGKLEAKLAPGDKPLDIEWLKDGRPIKPSDRVRPEQKPDGTVRLHIDDVKPEDAGRYSVVAKNPDGKTSSEADVTTKPEKPGAKQQKPAFEKELKPTTLTEEKPARLEAKLAPGSNPTSVKWLKDGKPIRPSSRVKTEEKPDGTLALVIDDVRPEDAGNYSVVAENDAGKAESEADVKTEPEKYRKQRKPAFEKELEPATLPEGKPARLEAKLEPDSNPTSIKWLKDGRTLRPSDRIKMEEKPDGTLALLIDDVQPEDAGKYAVVAANDAGEAESEAKIKTEPDKYRKQRKPAFEKELQPTTLADGKPARLEAKLEPDSNPTSIKWLKDGRPIRPSDRIRTEEKPDGTLALVIDEVKPEDAGHYTVVAANDAGEAASDADVKTKPEARVPGEKPEFVIELKNADLLEGQPLHLVGKVKSDSPFTTEWLKDGEKLEPSSGVALSQEPDGTVLLSIDHATPADAGKYVCVAKNPEGKAESKSTVKVAELPKFEPKIVDELKPAVFTEGEPGKLEAKVSGDPMPDVKWIKDGKELPDDNRIRSTTSPGGDVALTIDPVKPEDAGKYDLVAANDEGECRTSAPVTVNHAPKFVKPLEPVEVVEGYPARLEATLAGQPTPDTEWQKDGKPLIPDGKKIKETKTPSGDVALDIPKATPEDAGVYTCKAKNPLGEQETKAPLTVAASDSGDKAEEKPTVSPLDDVEVMESEPFTLEAKITGNPTPEVEWFFGGKPIPRIADLETTFDGRKARLSSKHSLPSHAGRYECRATNSAGKASSKATVGVTAMSKPYFTKRLTDTEASPSEPLKLVAKVKGYPEPEITWRYNGKVIEPSMRYTMSKEGETCTLTIPWPESKDCGLYECLAKNPVGEDKCSARVTIREKGEPPSFVKRLENLRVPEGDTATFTARIAGSPMPEVKWFKDGEELEFNRRHKMELEPNGTLRLTIRDCKQEDLGEYRASIYNPYGSDTCMATLRVESPYDDGKRRPSTDKYPSRDIPEKSDQRRGRSPSPRQYPEVNGYRRSPPRDDRRREPYSGPYSHELPPLSPLPSRDFDQPDYDPKSRHPPHPKYDDLDRPYDRLKRPDLEPEPYYAGVPDPLNDKPYIRRMTDRDLTLGWKPSPPSRSRIPVSYTVEMAPLPDGNWSPYRSGVKDTQLDVRGLEPFKDYRFRVRVGNKHGLSDPSPYVTAHRSRLGGSPPVPKEFKPKDYEIPHPPLDKPGEAPVFVRHEEDVMYGIRGHPVSIEFWVYGNPQPDISWTFKGTKVEMGGRYNSMQDRNGQVTLFISRMTEDNVGPYTCTAVNEHGQATKTIYVELAEEPVFTKRLEPTTIMLRRGGELQCRVIGKPYPKIKWFKDWQPICNSSRVSIIWEAPDTCTLALNSSIAHDAGLYSCSASNIAGTASCSAMLSIEEDESEFDLRTYHQPKVIRPKSTHLEDYYNLGDELGRGTQGVTYHAVERSTGRSFGAKTMHGRGQFKDWMKYELDMMNQLCHPRLIRLWDAFETKNSMSLITDFCGGGPLLDNIISQDRVTEHQIANYIKQILEGLNYMHAQNIAHLGLTLGDALVARENSDDIKIGDFSLSTRLPRGKVVIQEYRHPEFVAPEIANKKPASLASDMWSVGVISYILLSGISPFLGQNDRETLKNVQNGKINFLHDGFAKVSDEARDFISKLLVFEPSERMDVRTALEHPWLKITERLDRGESLSNIDRLREYQRRWRSWYSNASCRNTYRRRPMESCFTHPSKMIYPPDEVYTPPMSPDREITRSKVKSAPIEGPGKGPNDRLDIGSESSYQSGPDTYLLQLRDVDFPLRIRQYLRVGASRSPSLAASLRDRHWGGFDINERGTRNVYPQVVVRERRKFVDVMDEEIDDEKKGLGTRTLPLRLQREVGSLGYAHHQLEHLKHEAWKDKTSREKSIGMAPFFREKIEDCVILENDEVVFKCLAVGNPAPQYTWFRNDSLLIESSRVQITQDADGRSELRLKPGKAYDVGLFKCAARNSHGVTLCHARLKIGERPARPEPPICKQCSSHQAYVQWYSPKYDGNSRIFAFCLEYRQAGGEWTKISDVITQEFWVITDLTPSTSYTFRVSAKNKYGWSEASLPSELCTTEADGTTQKIQLSREHKHQEEIFEGEHEQEASVPLDYSQETSPVQLESGGLSELYTFSSELAVGRFGAVVSGTSKKLGSSLALKVVLTNTDPETSAHREYEVLKSLRHERIIYLKTASVHDDVVVLGLEKLCGMDVLTYLSMRHTYTEDMVVRIIKQVLDGLEYLHFRSICYIELQPDNVVLTDAHSCNIKLVDFGSANFVPRTGKILPLDTSACLEYLAPEVLKGNEVCHATDVWGVGVLTYILLSGYSPFLGIDEEDTKTNILYVRYHFDKLYKEASTEATRFLMQLFKRTPEKRPAISECLENKWMLPSEFMLRKRENSVFLSHKLQEFAADFHMKKKNASTAERLSKLLGLQLSRCFLSSVDSSGDV